MARVYKLGRITYAEPNVDDDGRDFPVPLEDLSIYVNLVVKVKNRTTSNTSGDYTYQISWIANGGDESSFLSGRKISSTSEQTYLTTFYTDISFNDGQNGEIVEGLGITNINIDFDSWYMPKIDIHFKDVRGISLFTPNEYQYLSGKNSENFANGFFKSFMAFPYPDFKLIVKGFYGNAVTYRLACVNFSSEFDSSSGNFDVVVNFIGFNYAFLADIRMDYLRAIPYDKYNGEKYFRDHALNDPNWRLSEGETIPTIIELENKIANGIATITSLPQNDKHIKRLYEINRLKGLLVGIQTEYGNLLNSLSNSYNIYRAPGSSQVAVFTKSGIPSSEDKNQLTISLMGNSVGQNTVYSQWTMLQKSIIDYNNSKTGQGLDFPNDLDTQEKLSTFCNEVKVTRVRKNDAFVGPDNIVGDDVKKLMSHDFNGIKMDKLTADYLIRQSEKSMMKELEPFMFLIDAGNLEKAIRDEIQSLEDELRKSKEFLKQYIEDQSKQVLGFRPTIKNISKILFAHLETFMNSLWTCASKANSRSIDNKEVLTNSDIVTNSSGEAEYGIPAFPAIRQSDPISKLYVDAWIGDVLGNEQPEAQFIYGLNRATQQVAEMEGARNEALSSDLNNDYAPILPLDVSIDRNPFNRTRNGDFTLADFTSHLGLRAMTVCSVAKDEGSDYINEVAKYDALNYYLVNNMRASKIVEQILAPLNYQANTSSKNGTDRMIKYLKAEEPNNIAGSSVNGKVYDYQYVKDKKFIIDAGNNYQYSYLNIGDNSLIPTIHKPFSGPGSYMTDYTSGENGDACHLPNSLTETQDSVYTINDQTVIDSHQTWQNTYMSPCSFSLITGSSRRDEILKFYNQYRGGNSSKPMTVKDTNISIPTERVLSDTIWKVTPALMASYYTNVACQLYDDFDARDYENEYDVLSKIATDEVINNWKNQHPYGKYPDIELFKYKRDQAPAFSEGKSNPSIITEDNGNLQYFYPAFWTLHHETTLFGDPFYYIQNEGDLPDDVRTKVKALLFLISLPINPSVTCKLFSQGMGVHLIPKHVSLFLGAMLWRRRYMIANGDDPIRYEENQSNPRLSFKRPTAQSTPNNEVLPVCSNIVLGGAEMNGVPSLFIPLTSKKEHVTYPGYTLKELFGENVTNLDYSIENALVSNFEQWATDGNSGFQRIMSLYELRKPSDGQNGETRFSGYDFTKFVEGLIDATNSEEEYAIGKYIRDNTNTNFTKAYYNLSISRQGQYSALALYNRQDDVMRAYILPLFSTGDLMIFTSSDILRSGSDPLLTVPKSTMESYMDMFMRTLSDICIQSLETQAGDPNKTAPNDVTPYSDLYNSMYLYLKKLYDSWLIGTNGSEFTIENYFNNNFVFVDSFYNQVGDRLTINCEYLLKRLMSTASSSSLYSFLTDLYSQHGCLFVTIPNFVNWADEKSLQNVFKPILPYEMETGDSTRFVIMYVHEPSKNLNMNASAGSYQFKNDDFCIISPDSTDANGRPEFDANVPDTFRQEIQEIGSFMPVGTGADKTSGNTTMEDVMLIPAFGVMFSKQNQSYFKNIKVGMSNPITTEASIAATYQIAESGGNGTETKGAFWGQDLYNVWSNYSYTCEFEMLGCAQIQPLMYFQLFNIPLFRGTYIVTKIKHNIRPGYMTTNVTGVRLCRYGKPFVDQSFGLFNIINKILDKVSTSYEGGDTVPNKDGVMVEPTTRINNNTSGPLVSNSVIDMMDNIGNYEKYTPCIPMQGDIESCGCGNNIENIGGIQDVLKSLFFSLRETIRDYHKVMGDGQSWNVCISSGARSGNINSQHYGGYAMDLQVTGGGRKALGVVFDILLQKYFDVSNTYCPIRQLIWEFEDSSTGTYPDHVVHVSTYSRTHSDGPMVFQAHKTKTGTYTVKDLSQLSDTFLFCIAKKYNYPDIDDNTIKAKVLSLQNTSNIKENILSRYWSRS